MLSKNFASAVIAASFALASASALADALAVDFEGFALSNLPGAGDTRAPGDANTWWNTSNGPTNGEVQAGVGLGGSKGLHLTNRGVNQGTIHNVLSGRLAQTAGETGTGATHKNFKSEYWFRTESTASLDDFQFKTETWGTDRTTWLGFMSHEFTYASGAPATDNGKIYVEATAYQGSGGTYTYLDTALGVTLEWGNWYRVVTNVLFVDGIDNDVVSFEIYDAGGGLVGTLGNNTWEQAQREEGFNGGQTVAADAVGFQMRGSSSAAGTGVFVDDVSWASFTVPAPATIGLVLLAGLAGTAARRRRA